MSDEEIDDEPGQLQADKGSVKKGAQPYKGKSDKPEHKGSESFTSQASPTFQNQQGNSHSLLSPQAQNLAFTGGNTLMHLNRIPDKLMIDTKPSKREKNEINLIKRMINSYFDVVKKNVNDLVPKTVITFFIKKTIDLSEKEMVHNLYDEKLIDSIMREDQDIVTQRKAVQANVYLLKECLILMAEFEHSR